jgi:hypothetical protein
MLRDFMAPPQNRESSENTLGWWLVNVVLSYQMGPAAKAIQLQRETGQRRAQARIWTPPHEETTVRTLRLYFIRIPSQSSESASRGASAEYWRRT